MKLFELNYNKSNKVLKAILSEGYGRVYDFDYTGDVVNDPKPSALSLGRFISPRRNQLMAGINLNYLSPQQITRLQQNLPTILKNRNLRKRARLLRAMMPDIFNSAYRTYKRSEVNNVDPNTLKFIKPQPGEVEQPQKPAPDYDPPKPTRVDQDEQPEAEEPVVDEPEQPKEPVRTSGSPARDLSDREKEKISEPKGQSSDTDLTDEEEPEEPSITTPETPQQTTRVGDEVEDETGSENEPDEEESP